jgi:hypothetical protein
VKFWHSDTPQNTGTATITCTDTLLAELKFIKMEVGESWQAMMLQNDVDANVRAPSGQHGYYNMACTDTLLA